MMTVFMRAYGSTAVARLSDLRYQSAIVLLADHMEELLTLEVGENEHHRDQCIDALTSVLQADMTVRDWIAAACKEVNIDLRDLMGFNMDISITFEKTDPSGTAHIRASGWVIKVNGNTVGPVFASRKEARVYAAMWMQ